MANRFSKKSQTALQTVHPDLQTLFEKVLPIHDCTIIEGRRSRSRQDELYRLGQSQLQWPQSKHNVTEPEALALAVDVAPYLKGTGIPWNDHRQFYYFAGLVKGIAEELGITIRWGGDWDSDQVLSDQNFFDLVHYEVVE